MYQQGVSMTSLDDVLAAADSGKSQLYHYFDSKADLCRGDSAATAAGPGRQPRLPADRLLGWDRGVGWRRFFRCTLRQAAVARPLGTIAAELKNDETFRPFLTLCSGSGKFRWRAGGK